MSRVLVTGGEGFIGQHLVYRLLEEGYEVTVLDALLDQAHWMSGPRLDRPYMFVNGRVSTATAVRDALKDVEKVVHLAAIVGVGQSMYEIARYTEWNTQDTARFLELLIPYADEIDRLVVASSMSVYGEGATSIGIDNLGGPIPTREEKRLDPRSVYAITKRDQEELCLRVGDAYGIPTVALRFFNTYGPGQSLANPYTGVAGIFASRMLHRQQPWIYDDGEQTRDFIHVVDVVEGIVRALISDATPGWAINLGTGMPVSINDVAAQIADGLDFHPVNPVYLPPRVGDIRHCYALTDRQVALLGDWEKIHPFEGLPQLAALWRMQPLPPQPRIHHAHDELSRRGLA